MNKESIFRHFSTIIDNTLDNSLFFCTYWQVPWSLETITGSIDDPAVPENLHFRFGISRGCIIDDGYDYVVKFDIDGDSFSESLCKREIEIFNDAKNYDLEAYFTEPVYIGSYCRTINFYNYEEIEKNMEDWCDYDPVDFDEKFMKNEDNYGEICPITISIPLYAYPRASVYTYTYFNEEDAAEYRNKVCSSKSPLRGRHTQIAMEFMFKYGEEQYNKMTKFMQEENINDIHYGNVGCLNGNLVFFDYAGWHSDYDDSYEDSFEERI